MLTASELSELARKLVTLDASKVIAERWSRRCLTHDELDKCLDDIDRHFNQDSSVPWVLKECPAKKFAYWEKSYLYALTALNSYCETTEEWEAALVLVFSYFSSEDTSKVDELLRSDDFMMRVMDVVKIYNTTIDFGINHKLYLYCNRMLTRLCNYIRVRYRDLLKNAPNSANKEFVLGVLYYLAVNLVGGRYACIYFLFYAPEPFDGAKDLLEDLQEEITGDVVFEQEVNALWELLSVHEVTALVDVGTALQRIEPYVNSVIDQTVPVLRSANLFRAFSTETLTALVVRVVTERIVADMSTKTSTGKLAVDRMYACVSDRIPETVSPRELSTLKKYVKDVWLCSVECCEIHNVLLPYLKPSARIDPYANCTETEGKLIQLAAQATSEILQQCDVSLTLYFVDIRNRVLTRLCEYLQVMYPKLKEQHKVPALLKVSLKLPKEHSVQIDRLCLDLFSKFQASPKGDVLL